MANCWGLDVVTKDHGIQYVKPGATCEGVSSRSRYPTTHHPAQHQNRQPSYQHEDVVYSQTKFQQRLSKDNPLAHAARLAGNDDGFHTISVCILLARLEGHSAVLRHPQPTCRVAPVILPQAGGQWRTKKGGDLLHCHSDIVHPIHRCGCVVFHINGRKIDHPLQGARQHEDGSADSNGARACAEVRQAPDAEDSHEACHDECAPANIHQIFRIHGDPFLKWREVQLLLPHPSAHQCTEQQLHRDRRKKRLARGLQPLPKI
mmetsp:Transcript_131015/g.184663  ORF Transcript_131015/g.184663 Transcript_131015/m.184663 type:complete len:261 (+) Transcript_131015:808-1590(+)